MTDNDEEEVVEIKAKLAEIAANKESAEIRAAADIDAAWAERMTRRARKMKVVVDEATTAALELTKVLNEMAEIMNSFGVAAELEIEEEDDEEL